MEENRSRVGGAGVATCRGTFFLFCSLLWPLDIPAENRMSFRGNVAQQQSTSRVRRRERRIGRTGRNGANRANNIGINCIARLTSASTVQERGVKAKRAHTLADVNQGAGPKGQRAHCLQR